jgi:hypothetical protein
MHPDLRNINISYKIELKGYYFIPFFICQFVYYLLNRNNLDVVVDIKKDYSLYFKDYSPKRKYAI